MGQFGIGQPIKRFEDQRLLRGEGRFHNDVNLPGQTHAVIVRSTHAHARIRSIDTAAALASPGVVAVFTGADLARDNLGTMQMTLKRKRPDGSPMFAPPHRGLTADRVCQGRPAADPGGRPSGEAAMSDNGFCVIYAPGGCRADTARGTFPDTGGRPAPARSAALRRAHALDPVDPEIVYALAVFYLRQGRDERAMMYARRLAELVPEDPRAGVIVDRVGQKRSSGRSAS